MGGGVEREGPGARCALHQRLAEPSEDGALPLRTGLAFAHAGPCLVELFHRSIGEADSPIEPFETFRHDSLSPTRDSGNPIKNESDRSIIRRENANLLPEERRELGNDTF